MTSKAPVPPFPWLPESICPRVRVLPTHLPRLGRLFPSQLRITWGGTRDSSGGVKGTRGQVKVLTTFPELLNLQISCQQRRRGCFHFPVVLGFCAGDAGTNILGVKLALSATEKNISPLNRTTGAIANLPCGWEVDHEVPHGWGSLAGLSVPPLICVCASAQHKEGRNTPPQ